MSVYIDRKFLGFVSSKLEQFKQKQTDLYNFRCPYCGDSKKNKLKARGYVYRKSNDYFWNRLMVQPISSTSWNDTQLVKQDTALTPRSLISNNSRETPTPDSSLLSTTPEEIQRNLKAWREHGDRLHIIV
jgi:hypothetical protein